jgi:hypothetical protein
LIQLFLQIVNLPAAIVGVNPGEDAQFFLVAISVSYRFGIEPDDGAPFGLVA